MNKKKRKCRVTLVYKHTDTFDVEATDEQEAQCLAIEQHDTAHGDLSLYDADFDWVDDE